jgi:peptide chain release factor 1
MAEVLSTTDEKILAKLAELATRYDELESQMNDPAVASDPNQIVKIAREHGQMRELIGRYRQLEDLRRQLDEAQVMLDDPETDTEMKDLAREEVESLSSQCSEVMSAAKESLVMSDDAHVGSVILEIRAGTGGDEAALFAGDLYDMYSRFAEKRGWKIEPMSFSGSEMGGYKEVIVTVKGDGVWQALGYEGGGHRVQRVPETESQGRVHTSAATVAVLPEPENVEIEIPESDVEEHVARSSGPGGQSVNKTSSAIKLVHKPTGITVSMQDEKSQHKNRSKAWRILRSRVYDRFEQEKRAERDSTRKNMIGSGDRSQRIRTYNFPQNRLTDHRINLTLYSLDKIIMGDLDDVSAALIDYDKQQRLENI